MEAQNKLPLVSVIIPTLGRSTIEQTKSALSRQTYPVHEVIIAIDIQRKGTSWARNQGYSRSSGDLIMFIDDDCIPPDNWVERFVNGHRRFEAQVVGGTFIESQEVLQDARKRQRFPDQEVHDYQGWVGNGGNISFERTYLEKCRDRYGYLWDESIIMGEDHEFAWRLRGLGAHFAFVPANPIHLKRLGFFSYLKFRFVRGIGTAQLQHVVRKNPEIIPFQKSLVWSQAGLNPWTWILKGFVVKVLGPLDFGNFSSVASFLFFWIGSKSEVFGYLWQLMRQR